jgi:hypothetical protein
MLGAPPTGTTSASCARCTAIRVDREFERGDWGTHVLYRTPVADRH